MLFRSSPKLNTIIVGSLLTNPFNVAKRIMPTNRFLSVSAPDAENIFSLPIVKQIGVKTEYSPYLLIENYLATNYVLFYNVDIQRDSIVCISNLEKEYLRILKRVYNYERLYQVSQAH